MKLIDTKDAVGHVLCQDITQIIKGVTKDAVFRKGHVVTEEDIPVLLSVGKYHLYVWENDDTMMHENDAAEVLCSLCINDNMKKSEPKEGKIELTSEIKGLLKVNKAGIKCVNSFGQMMIASRHGNFIVEPGEKICGTRIIPLVIEKEKMEGVEKACKEITAGEPIFKLLPFPKKKVGIVTTGSEVYNHIIEDTFTPVMVEKVSEFDAEVICHETYPDNDANVSNGIVDMINKGCDLIICTGGMSVDPDDRTPLAIKNTGARIVSYGAPVLPGAMFLLSYYEKDNKNVPVIGVPGCAMYAKRTILDLILPRLMADDPVTADDMAELGEGGLCLNCNQCTFPNCGFGK